MGRWVLIFLCWLSALPSWAGDFEAANQLFDQGKFAEAKGGYQKLVDAGEWSANLFYNLGNTEHRLGAPGAAMLDFERALTLDLSHPEARANLEFLRGQVGAVPWPTSWIDRLFPQRWVNVAAVVGALAGWVAVFSLVWILVTPRGEKWGLWFGAFVALFVASYAAAVVWRAEQHRTLAVVTAKSAEVHLAPAESSTPGQVLPAGSEVRVLSERGDWIYCALPGQSRGWLPATSLARVRLGAS